MKTATIAIIAAAAALSISAGYAQTALGVPNKHLCIQTSMIDSMTYPDDKTIIFHMTGGPVKTYRNDLPAECPGLKFEQGIAWNIWGGEVCSNMQIFYVLHRGTPCALGAFTPVELRTPPPH
ncbi:MAG TPA: hypothetical protein VMU01_07085 [Rhizomicrobium sp.]|nr:hypothetical protein [Rhizomicrobium sp.]